MLLCLYHNLFIWTNSHGFSIVFSFMAVFQILLGLQYSVLWPSIYFGRGSLKVNIQQKVDARDLPLSV